MDRTLPVLPIRPLNTGPDINNNSKAINQAKKSQLTISSQFQFWHRFKNSDVLTEEGRQLFANMLNANTTLDSEEGIELTDFEYGKCQNS